MIQMFSPLGSLAFLIPAIIYLVIIGFVIWLIVRLVRSNEDIAENTAHIARALHEKNRIESQKSETDD